VIVGVVADIHANLTAFEAVLNHLKQTYGRPDVVWCLGDIVGYGPDPNECIDLLRQFEFVAVVGNHDLAAIGLLELDLFNPDARVAAVWTGQVLRPDNRLFLQNLPRRVVRDEFTIVHGSPRSEVWEYLLTVSVACENFQHFETRFCLVGHSHIPVIFGFNPNTGNCAQVEVPPVLDLGKVRGRLIINPGSVGQPRDRDPRAAYAAIDTEKQTIYHHRVEYNIRHTAEKMLRLGLPERLAIRLNYGI
jgi:predicted phosphodiesterase